MIISELMNISYSSGMWCYFPLSFFLFPTCRVDVDGIEQGGGEGIGTLERGETKSTKYWI